jgi:hypothetical protein
MIATFPVGTHFPALIRVSPTVVSLDNSKAQPAGENTSFSRAVYARGSAYGATQPFLPSWVLFVTRHFTSATANGWLKRASNAFASSGV